MTIEMTITSDNSDLVVYPSNGETTEIEIMTFGMFTVRDMYTIDTKDVDAVIKAFRSDNVNELHKYTRNWRHEE